VLRIRRRLSGTWDGGLDVGGRVWLGAGLNAGIDLDTIVYITLLAVNPAWVDACAR
jgi:hypothetical protein